MSDYFFDEVQRQYDNMLPERYNRKPLFECECCGCGICAGQDYFDVYDNRICEKDVCAI